MNKYRLKKEAVPFFQDKYATEIHTFDSHHPDNKTDYDDEHLRNEAIYFRSDK